jgi:hypothetical protein
MPDEQVHLVPSSSTRVLRMLPVPESSQTPLEPHLFPSDSRLFWGLEAVLIQPGMCEVSPSSPIPTRATGILLGTIFLFFSFKTP